MTLCHYPKNLLLIIIYIYFNCKFILKNRLFFYKSLFKIFFESIIGKWEKSLHFTFNIGIIYNHKTDKHANQSH